MRASWTSCAVVMALLAAAMVGCGGDEQPPRARPNVLLIVVDTLRADHCSAYGYDRPTTPRMEQLAAQGVRFDIAYAPAASTAPSHATLFTATYPITHRLVKNGLALDETFPTLAEHLRDVGYDTAGVVSSFVMDAKFGLSRGFDYYDDQFPAEQAGPGVHGREWEGHTVEGVFDRTADHTSDSAIRWLRETRDADRPFFLFVHYFDPHMVYDPPEPYRSRFAPKDPDASVLDIGIGWYDGEIAFTDAEIGRLLDALDELGLADDTLVILTADHGEGLMDHGVLAHAMNIYEEAVRVPMVIRHTGRIPAGRVAAGPAQLVDLLPTILAHVDVHANGDHWQGASVVTLWGDGPPPASRDVFLQRRHYDGNYLDGGFNRQKWVMGELFGIRRGDWKYIEGHDEDVRELYNLRSDPRELRNVVAAEPKVAEQLAARLHAWMRDNVREAMQRPALSDEDRARLEALGYIA